MADIGSASLLVVPRFDGLTDKVNAALAEAGAKAGAAGQGLGAKTASGFGRGLATSGATIGAFSAITSAAMSSISSHVGDAISRFDTLNQYPKTMELLGYSSESAEASVNKLADRLQALPTRLDDMVGTVQGIVAITGDLDQATDAGLALNDMLVASGANQQLVTSAMEQFRQMLAKGKPEMEDWRSLTSAAPGQMAQLARAMLGPTANANDLYAALGGGKNDPTITFDELIDKMIELDTVGGEGITSFREQAETAAGGVQTALSNMSNAVTKGIASIMDEVGKDRISGFLGDVKSGINEVFSVATDVVGGILPMVDDLYGTISEAGPELATWGASFLVLKTGGGILADFASRAKEAAGASSLLEGANTLLGTSFTPLGVGITVGAAALGIIATQYLDAAHDAEMLETATSGLSDVVSDTGALDGYAGSLSDVGEQSAFAAMSVDELAETTAKRVDSMRETTAAAEAEIAQLNTAQGIINQYVGATDLSAEAQGRLEWALKLANDQFGLSITQADVAAGAYTDANGEVQNLRDSINSLIDAKKEEARVSAITANLTEAYGARSDAAATLAKSQRDYNAALEEYNATMDAYDRGEQVSLERRHEVAAALDEAEKGLESSRQLYDESADAAANLEQQLGDTAAAASEAANEYDRLSATMDGGKYELFSAQLQAAGTSFSGLADDLEALGADTGRFADLTEGELQTVAESYDGTAASIVDELARLGVSMDAAAADAARASAGIMDALDQMGATGALEDAGADVDLLSQKLAEAGVETGYLAAIGSANLSSLAAACEGNVDRMVWAITNYNNVPIVNKDGSVTVDDAQLVDAQGRVAVWNGSSLVYQDTGVSVEDGQLIDAQGRVYVWNGSSLKTLHGYAFIDGNLGSALVQMKNWNDGYLASYYGLANIRQVYTTVHDPGHAAGGIRTHADGGIVSRYHARGSVIVNRPGSGVSLDYVNDIVGEDGAEAIVPLTNRRYSQPFVDLIADGIQERFAAAPVTNYNLTLDGIGTTARIERIMLELLDELERVGVI